ncbi:MAG TPA: 50S ribosomal protein L23 [Candidatus Paceibacterota bacterium]
MSLNPFKKEEKNRKAKPSKKEDVVDERRRGNTENSSSNVSEETKETVFALPITGNAEAYRVLKNFYVSEKASLLNGFNQYVFKVFRSANKSQIKKQVENLFNVKIKSVKVLNMPRKRRDLGKHTGFKSEFKKAIVVLEKGQTIEQAKP